jgi:hypothetical protein
MVKPTTGSTKFRKTKRGFYESGLGIFAQDDDGHAHHNGGGHEDAE